MNIFDPIFFQAKLAPHRPALGFPGGFISYGQLATGASAIALAASSVGLRQGDVVALDLVNPAFQIMTMIGLGRAGITTLTAGSRNAATYAGLNIRGYIGDKPTDIFGHAKTIVADDKWFLGKIHSKVSVPFRGIDIGPDETCRIALSSGTTGRPKAIALTTKCMEVRLSRATINSLGARTLSLLGLTTSWGFLIMMRTLRNGGMYCFAPRPDHVLDLCLFAQIRDIWASTDQLATLVRAQGERQRSLPALESVTVGGSSISPLLIAEARQRLCKNIVLTYGATETGPAASSPSDHIPETPGAVGYLFPWMKLEIVDEDGRNLGFDREGIVRIGGEDCVSSYLVADEQSEGLFKDGWFYPGDLGTLRKDGLLTVVGRTSEVINRGGVKIAPAMIEDILKSHPAIADAGVVAVTDAKGMPQIWAGVVARGNFSEAEVLAFAHGKLGNIAPNRLVAVATVPRNQSGKIIRPELTELMQRPSEEKLPESPEPVRDRRRI